MNTAVDRHSGLVPLARLAQVVTIAWLLIEASVAIASGLLARSVALTAFGADSLIEIATAAIVLRQLLRPTDADPNQLDQGARQASRLVGWGLYGLIAYIVLSSAYALLSGTHPEASRAGLLLAVAAVVIMPVLWRWRLSLSGRLHSAALRADAACSAVCVYMSGALLAGLLLNQLFGWWWADPVAGLAMIWWIRGEASEALEAAATGHHCEDC